jgi:hypothetical protein
MPLALPEQGKPGKYIKMVQSLVLFRLECIETDHFLLLQRVLDTGLRSLLK